MGASCRRRLMRTSLLTQVLAMTLANGVNCAQEDRPGQQEQSSLHSTLHTHTNEWAIKFHNGDVSFAEQADKVAHKYGLVNLGQVLLSILVASHYASFISTHIWPNIISRPSHVLFCHRSVIWTTHFILCLVLRVVI